MVDGRSRVPCGTGGNGPTLITCGFNIFIFRANHNDKLTLVEFQIDVGSMALSVTQTDRERQIVKNRLEINYSRFIIVSVIA